MYERELYFVKLIDEAEEKLERTYLSSFKLILLLTLYM